MLDLLGKLQTFKGLLDHKEGEEYLKKMIFGKY